MGEEKTRVEKRVSVLTEDWEKIVKYLYDTPVSFTYVEKATEVKKILDEKWLLVDVTINEQG
jgi:hypothetical protein